MPENYLASPEVDRVIRAGIEDARLIELLYGGGTRVVEPHDYGEKNGVVKLLAFQVAGTSTHPLPNWRWFEADKISSVRLLERSFRGGRPNPSGKHHHWDKLFARVRPGSSPE